MTGDAVDTEPADELRLHIVSDAVRHHILLILAVVLVVTGAVGAFAFTRPPSYTSTAKVVLRPIAGNAFSEQSATNAQQVTIAMETEAGLVSSPAVAKLASKALGTEVAAGSDAVNVKVPPSTQIVQIEFTADTPGLAQKGAQAFADAFLAYRAGQASSIRGRQLKILRTQATTATKSLRRASARAARTNAPPEAAAQVQLYTGRVASLQDSIGSLQATPTDAGSIVTPATAPDGPDGLGPAVLTVLASLLALGLGAALALWRERVDDRVRVASSSLDGVPLLATVPLDPGGPSAPSADDEVAASAYRMARTGVTALAAHPSALLVSAVSDAVPPEATAEVTARLALALTASGYRTVVVDATLGAGGVARWFDVDAEPGLSDVLVDENRGTATVHARDVDVLPAGTRPGSAAELLGGEGLTLLLARLRERADFVLVAGHRVGTAEGGAVAQACDGVVLLVGDRATTHREVSLASHQVTVSGTSVLGAIGVPRRRRRGRHGAVTARPAGPVPAHATTATAAPTEPAVTATVSSTTSGTTSAGAIPATSPTPTPSPPAAAPDERPRTAAAVGAGDSDTRRG